MRVPDKIVSLIGHDGYEWMASQAKQMTSIVEVGCWQGAGTWTLCTACSGPVYAVDHWLGSPAQGDATHAPAFDVYAKFWENVGHFPNLRVLKMTSAEAAKQFAPKSIDMIVIDAGHDGPSVDLDMAVWFPVCKSLFCGHDWAHVPVQAAVQRLGSPVTHHPADMWSVRCDG